VQSEQWRMFQEGCLRKHAWKLLLQVQTRLYRKRIHVLQKIPKIWSVTRIGLRAQTLRGGAKGFQPRSYRMFRFSKVCSPCLFCVFDMGFSA